MKLNKNEKKRRTGIIRNITADRPLFTLVGLSREGLRTVKQHNRRANTLEGAKENKASVQYVFKGSGLLNVQLVHVGFFLLCSDEVPCTSCKPFHAQEL